MKFFFKQGERGGSSKLVHKKSSAELPYHHIPAAALCSAVWLQGHQLVGWHLWGGLSLGAGLPGVLAQLLTSSSSPQRWSRTSCAAFARCCESWTGITLPASAIEVRQTPGTAPGVSSHLPQRCLSGALLGPKPPHSSPLSDSAWVGGHRVASAPWHCSAFPNLLSEVLSLWQAPGGCCAPTSAAFIPP